MNEQLSIMPEQQGIKDEQNDNIELDASNNGTTNQPSELDSKFKVFSDTLTAMANKLVAFEKNNAELMKELITKKAKPQPVQQPDNITTQNKIINEEYEEEKRVLNEALESLKKSSMEKDMMLSQMKFETALAKSNINPDFFEIIINAYLPKAELSGGNLLIDSLPINEFIKTVLLKNKSFIANQPTPNTTNPNIPKGVKAYEKKDLSNLSIDDVRKIAQGQAAILQ